MIKIRYVLVLLLLTASIFSLFQIKFKVQELHREALELKKELEHEKTSIHVLKAEWAYLNDPKRLIYLSEKFLDLAQIKPQQLLPTEDGLMITPVMSANIEENISNNIVKVNYKPKGKSGRVKRVKWNYRERPIITTRPKK